MLAMLLAVAALLQDPPAPPAPPPDPARAMWEGFQQRLGAAQALQLEASITVEPAPDPVSGERAGPVIRLALTARMAQPGAGTVQLTGTLASEDGDEPEQIALSFLGTRDGVYFADPQEAFAMWEAESWSGSQFGSFLPYLGATWSAASLEPDEFELLAAVAEHPDWRGLRVRGQDSYEIPVTLDLWFDAAGALQRSSSPAGDGTTIEIAFSAFQSQLKADAETFFATIPQDWEVVSQEDQEEDEAGGGGLEDSLLPLGADAPDVTFIGLDDVTFSLASLRGKTVMLNFWFFH